MDAEALKAVNDGLQAVLKKQDEIRATLDQHDDWISKIDAAYRGRRWSGDGEAGSNLPTALDPAGTQRAYEPGQRIAAGERASSGERLSLGRMLIGRITGRWDGADAEQKAMAGGLDTIGGFTVPGAALWPVLDVARAKTNVIRAGAKTVLMRERDGRVPRLLTDPTVTWKAENATASASDLTFDAVNVRLRMMFVFCKLSRELFDFGQGAADAVENAIAQSIALEFDRVALRGTGIAEEPLGISGTSGVGSIASIAVPEYLDFVQAQRDVRIQNGEPTAVILAPRDMGVLDGLKDTTGQPIQRPKALDSLLWLPTNQCRTTLGGGSNEGEAFVGDFSQLALCTADGGMQIMATEQAGDATGGALTAGQVWIRGILYADVAVLRPNHFVYMSGITTS